MRILLGCWWWLGTVGLVLFLIGLALVYPWLLIVTGILFVFTVIFIAIKEVLKP